MIKLSLPEKPRKLEENENVLKAEFRADPNKCVWKKDYITTPLLEMTHGKCAYSETKLNEESKYMEVEHFKHKSQYPEEVVTWGNLLPSCKTCNISKGTWDVVADPIIDPLTDNPGEHLYIKFGRFHAKDEKGQNTLDALDLNNIDEFMVPRFRIANYTVDSLSDALISLQEADTSQKRKIRVSKIKSILRACGPQSPYSASTATYILYNWEEYGSFKKYLTDNGYWDNDFKELIATLETIALPKS